MDNPLAAVAHEAHTTRQALYRRWPTKASLAAAALTTAVDAPDAAASESPLTDLAAELANFERGVSRAGRRSLVGTMLQGSTAPEALTRYRSPGHRPRRARIRRAPSSKVRLPAGDPRTEDVDDGQPPARAKTDRQKAVQGRHACPETATVG